MTTESIIDRIVSLLDYDITLPEIRARLMGVGVSNEMVYLCWCAARLTRARRC